jgi:hypothetical protein
MVEIAMAARGLQPIGKEIFDMSSTARLDPNTILQRAFRDSREKKAGIAKMQAAKDARTHNSLSGALRGTLPASSARRNVKPPSNRVICI